MKQGPRERGTTGPVLTAPLILHPRSLSRPQPHDDVSAAHVVVRSLVCRDGQRRPPAVHHHVGPYAVTMGTAVVGGHDVEMELVHATRRGCERAGGWVVPCLLYTSPSPRDRGISRMPSSA